MKGNDRAHTGLQNFSILQICKNFFWKAMEKSSDHVIQQNVDVAN